MLRQAGAGLAPAAAKPLRQLLQTLDDRERAAENDPRARRRALRPPRIQHRGEARGKGFTGFEGILNYAYWQTLAINQFDTIGHFLRAVADRGSAVQPVPERPAVRRRGASQARALQLATSARTSPASRRPISAPMAARQPRPHRARRPRSAVASAAARGEPEAAPAARSESDYSRAAAVAARRPSRSCIETLSADARRSRAPGRRPPAANGRRRVPDALDYLLAP